MIGRRLSFRLAVRGSSLLSDTYSHFSAAKVLQARSKSDTSAIETPPSVVTASNAELAQVLPISHELGKLRGRSLESRGVTVRYAAQTGSQELVAPLARRPLDSWLEMTYPFSSSPQLRLQYQRFKTDMVRMGLILEDVDGFAGDIAHRHTRDENLSHVTASVDQITWLASPPEGSVCLMRDLRLTGQVSWVGTSSMEVLLEAHTRKSKDDSWTFGGLARFVMVARDPLTGKASPVATLQTGSAQQRYLYTLGHHNRDVRKRKRESSLNKRAPTIDEIALLHAVVQPERGMPRVSMDSTARHSVRLMNSQDRNVQQRIYGGYLLREAFELAFATASLHAREVCEPVSMEDVAFLHPVHIGSILQFTAQVIFVSGPVLRVNVRAETLGQDAKVTNDFTIAFKRRGGPVAPVVPSTIAEGWLYIHGYRQHQSEQRTRKSGNARIEKAHGSAHAFPLREL